MVKKDNISLPNNFVDIIDHLDDHASIPTIEAKIIDHATQMFDAKWGSIKYYYGNQFVNGFTSVPPQYRLKPRKNGFMFRTVNRNKPHVMSERVIRKTHPEADPGLKSILLAPLRMDESTTATVSLIDTKNRKLTRREVELLNDFGTIYGRVLNMAHKFAAEKKAVSNRDKFMSFAAHEIKNPLMALSSYVQIIQRSLKKGAPIKEEWLLKMTEEVNRMRSLIDEFLNVRQSHDGEMSYNLQSISLKKLISQVCDNFQVRNPKRAFSVMYRLDQEDIQIYADEIKLSQVLLNLLNNAHKFSDNEKEIRCVVTATKNTVKITIKDKGIGIPVEEVPFIFNEYYRGSNGEHKKGIGVGLFLVKSIIESHQGSVNVKSVLGKGTTFIVTLPLVSAT